jgi:hypothetical protein
MIVCIVCAINFYFAPYKYYICNLDIFLEFISAPKIPYFALIPSYNYIYIIELDMLVLPEPLLHHIHAKLTSNLDNI